MRRSLTCVAVVALGVAALDACGGGPTARGTAATTDGTADAAANDGAGGGGSGTDGGSPAASGTTTTRGAAPTTTTPPYSFDGSVPPPDLLNTGTDYAAIFESLVGYRSWLVRHRPDEDLVAEAYAAGTPTFEALRGDLQLLSEGRQRLVELGQEFEVEIASADVDIVTLRVREHIDANQLIGSTGQILEQAPSGPVNDYIVLLVADSDGRWRVGDVTASTAHAEVHL